MQRALATPSQSALSSGQQLAAATGAAGAQPDLTPSSVSVAEWKEEISPETGQRVVFYVLEVHTDTCHMWQTKKRYSEFSALRDQMVHSRGDMAARVLGASILSVSFPSKQMLAGPETFEQRREQLELWLNKVLAYVLSSGPGQGDVARQMLAKFLSPSAPGAAALKNRGGGERGRSRAASAPAVSPLSKTDHHNEEDIEARRSIQQVLVEHNVTVEVDGGLNSSEDEEAITGQLLVPSSASFKNDADAEQQQLQQQFSPASSYAAVSNRVAFEDLDIDADGQVEPGSIHHAAVVYLLADDCPAWQKTLWLSFSYGLALLQCFVMQGATNRLNPMHTDCTLGGNSACPENTFCARNEAKTNNKCMFCGIHAIFPSINVSEICATKPWYNGCEQNQCVQHLDSYLQPTNLQWDDTTAQQVGP